MRVLVCGGRNFYNKALIKKTLDELHERRKIGPIIISSSFELKGADIPIGPITCIIHGGASGADFLAKHWAIAYGGMPEQEFKADWRNQGRSAGPRRNAVMLAIGRPDLVTAFGSEENGTRGNGTADMVKKARRAGLTVIEISDI